LIALIVVIPGIGNNNSKHVAFQENSLQDVSMQSLVSKRWVNILEEEASK